MVIVELNLLDDNKIEPIYILSHLAVFAHQLPTRVILGTLKLCQPLLLLHVHLTMLTSFEALGDASTRLPLSEALEPLQCLHSWCHYTAIGLNQLGEVGEERVRRLQKIKSWIPYLALSQAL